MYLPEQEEIELLELMEEEWQEQAKRKHQDFMDYCWRKGKDNPLVVGLHTRKICEKIDEAMDKYRRGISSYLLINVHHRSGKTDIVSRYLGAHFLGEFPDAEVMQVTYQANLASNLSAFGRNVFRSEQYRRLYPDIRLSKETNKKNDWVVCDNDGKETGGKLYASGLQSGLTGNGFSLGILDDYFKGRAEAESRVQRDNAWHAFTDDFMTRRAPVTIVIVLATQWHWDDVSGRIRSEMKKNPDFPQFETLAFPARRRDAKNKDEYPGEFLFLERYPESWYREQYATLGKYSAAALMDCDPQMRGGGILSTDGIVFHDADDKAIPSKTAVQWARVWDLAHTEKQRSGDDPDYTSGTLLAFERRPGDPVPHLWVKHRARFRDGAVERDNKIRFNAMKDGNFAKQVVESSLDAKDAYHYLRKAMPEISWNKIITKGDKVVRCTPLEPIFEAEGHVHVIRGEWNDEWIDELQKFTGSGNEHDDGIDNLSAGYQFLISDGLNISTERKKQLAQRRRQ
jgi:phage terminase large subunit-like protein